MSVIKGEKKQRQPKWYETPTGKLRLKFIVFASRMPYWQKSPRKISRFAWREFLTTHE